MMPKDELLEQVLILRCQLRDPNALAELMRRYERPLRYFVSRMVGNADNTEELLQETWLSVLRRITTLTKPEAFSTWLYRIARNRVYQELRKNRHYKQLDDTIESPATSEEEATIADDVAKLHACLQRLCPEHKEVLMLRFLEQMSYEQMTTVLGCQVGTVRSRIHYAKLALKKEMEKPL